MDDFGRVVIVGVGLIGGSIGRALRERGLASEVVGFGRDGARLEAAVRLGAIDRGEADRREAVAEADVVVVCTPVGRIARDAIGASHHCPAGALITDAGSTKRAIVEAVEADPTALSKFVAAHPIAGSERQGVENARPDLFEGRACALTPTPRTPPGRLARARAFWSSLGCRLIELDPADHDERLARTSHLPHALAAALASVVGPTLAPLAAGAYRDGTRVAGADASLWVPIFLENRRAVLDALDAFGESLASFRSALEAEDEPRLCAWWEAGRANRRAFDDGNGSSPAGPPSRQSGPTGVASVDDRQ